MPNVMPNLNVTFPNTRGETLAGILNLPASKPLAYALFAHCFTCSKDIKAAGNIARALNDEGIAVLRFDFTGLGQSEGEFADTNFSSNVVDFSLPLTTSRTSTRRQLFWSATLLAALPYYKRRRRCPLPSQLQRSARRSIPRTCCNCSRAPRRPCRRAARPRLTWVGVRS